MSCLHIFLSFVLIIMSIPDRKYCIRFPTFFKDKRQSGKSLITGLYLKVLQKVAFRNVKGHLLISNMRQTTKQKVCFYIKRA